MNECIQKRFLDRTAFGMSRILPDGFHGVRQFRSENPRETAILDRLRSQGYEVALYLTGRDSLTRPVQGPAYITRLSDPDTLPPPSALLAASSALLFSAPGSPRQDVQLGEWTVTMRPLRAQNEACVQCHLARAIGAKPEIKIGDSLGVVSYVYRRQKQDR